MSRTLKEIFGVVNRNNQNYWTRIGTAFENARDGSWNLRFDYLPLDGNTTIQLRDPKPATGDKQDAPEQAPTASGAP
jgi:hypothetical protein